MAALTIQLDDPALDTKATEGSASLINAIIPSLITRRAGRLPSLRRTFASSGLEKQQARPPPSPPPPYFEPQDGQSDGTDGSQDALDCFGRLLGTHRSGDVVYYVAKETSTSQVRWKHVSEGRRLIECAGREAASDDEDPELARKMFIDGVGYLLKSLPDLSADETVQLSNYLPVALRTTEGLHPAQSSLDEDSGECPDRSNYVYQFVAVATMYAVLLATLVLPILERFATSLYRYDRRHQISARVADSASQALSSVARRIFAALNEGKTGEMALGLTLYTVEGASRGFLDGYAQAVARQKAIDRSSDNIDPDSLR